MKNSVFGGGQSRCAHRVCVCKREKEGIFDNMIYFCDWLRQQDGGVQEVRVTEFPPGEEYLQKESRKSPS